MIVRVAIHALLSTFVRSIDTRVIIQTGVFYTRINDALSILAEFILVAFSTTYYTMLWIVSIDIDAYSLAVFTT